MNGSELHALLGGVWIYDAGADAGYLYVRELLHVVSGFEYEMHGDLAWRESEDVAEGGIDGL